METKPHETVGAAHGELESCLVFLGKLLARVWFLVSKGNTSSGSEVLCPTSWPGV